MVIRSRYPHWRKTGRGIEDPKDKDLDGLSREYARKIQPARHLAGYYD
jgi:hypothetical protein